MEGGPTIKQMSAVATEQDRVHLRRALELAEGGRGRVSPNPLVGAVLVREGEVLGEGFHAGSAICTPRSWRSTRARRRGEDPAGATLYVTLEPCAHHGRQPPCTEAILGAAIARVVIASEDPSEKASGRGPGFSATEGSRSSCDGAGGGRGAAPEPAISKARPHRAAVGGPEVGAEPRRAGGDRRAVTRDGSPARRAASLVASLARRVRRGRVGIGTALADDPLLTAREAGEVRQPTRVVFDSRRACRSTRSSSARSRPRRSW